MDATVFNESKSKEKGEREADENRKKNIDAGMPESALGPSGKPKIKVKDHSSRKRAKDTANSRSGRGNSSDNHNNPTKRRKTSLSSERQKE